MSQWKEILQKHDVCTSLPMHNEALSFKCYYDKSTPDFAKSRQWNDREVLYKKNQIRIHSVRPSFLTLGPKATDGKDWSQQTIL